MTNSKNIQSEVEKTLNSLDNWKKIETDSFFYTRLSVRLENKRQIKNLNWFFDSLLLRPALMVFALLINILSINYFISNSNSIQEDSSDFANLFNDEYMLDQSTDSYFMLNDE